MKNLLGCVAAAVLALGLASCTRNVAAPASPSRDHHEKESATMENATFAAGCFGASRQLSGKSRV